MLLYPYYNNNMQYINCIKIDAVSTRTKVMGDLQILKYRGTENVQTH